MCAHIANTVEVALHKAANIRSGADDVKKKCNCCACANNCVFKCVEQHCYAIALWLEGSKVYGKKTVFDCNIMVH